MVYYGAYTVEIYTPLAMRVVLRHAAPHQKESQPIRVTTHQSLDSYVHRFI